MIVDLPPSPSSTMPRDRRHCPKELLDESAATNLPLSLLLRGGFARFQPLPLDVSVTSTSKQADGKVVYHVTVTSRASRKSWVVSYRYAQFVVLKDHIEYLATCRTRSCTGSCFAVRRMLLALIPRSRLFVAGMPSVVKERQAKLENTLRYLLASVFLAGSALKCAVAQSGLPELVFKFLDVHDDVDKRPLVHSYLESSLENVTDHDSRRQTSEEELQCAICMDDANAQQDSVEAVALACGHRFHRACISEWLEKQLHCPMCRRHVAPVDAVAVYCYLDNISDCSQWWMLGSDTARNLKANA